MKSSSPAISRKVFTLLVASCVACGGCSYQRGTRQPVSLSLANGETEVDCLVYLPAEYDSATHKWPLILFLHGAGQRGDDLELVKKHGLPRRIGEGADFPCLVVSPQCRSHAWDAEALSALLDSLIERYEVDADRVYVTGLSMGGFGTWMLATHCPERFAAIAPLCGGGDASQANRLKDLPIWAFHGAQDDVIPVEATREMVAAVEAVGGSVRFTEYPDAKHDCWTQTYNNPELTSWLLRHKRR